jgi:hypothetical protein
VFRRHADAAPEATDSGADQDGTADGGERQPSGAWTAAKGRPTPKRSESERRRGPYQAPADRKAAATQARSRERETRGSRYAAVKRGENWALPRKDQGPVRALARDVVDSRRRISEYYMYAVGLLVVLLFIPSVRAYADYLVVLVLVLMIGEGTLIGRRVSALAAQRCPGESLKGVKLYSAIRATQIRKLRVPAPRIKPGDSF